jgi:hypothetical protein
MWGLRCWVEQPCGRVADIPANYPIFAALFSQL